MLFDTSIYILKYNYVKNNFYFSSCYYYLCLFANYRIYGHL